MGEQREVAPRTLYLVATPIGNLGDITRRAIAVLAQADLLLAEDTRRTRKLLSHLGLPIVPQAYHEHNEQARTPAIVEQLQRGVSVALVSDAGTPAISDPGYRLVRAAIDAGVAVVPVPGPSAPLAALIASGLPTDRFSFLGYPPRKPGGRRRFFADAIDIPGTLVLLESPRRLTRTLRTAVEILGGHRAAVVAREITKVHEQFLRGTLGELLELLGDQPLRGEVTLCIRADSAPSAAGAVIEPAALVARYEALVAAGTERREAIRTLARETGLRRRDVYNALLEDDDASS